MKVKKPAVLVLLAVMILGILVSSSLAIKSLAETEAGSESSL